MNLEIGADVLGPDGKLGTLTQIVIEPLGERITHVVIARDGMHAGEKLVPITHLQRSEGDRIWTDLRQADMDAFPDYRSYRETAAAPATPHEVPLGDLRPVGLLWPSNVLGWYLPAHQANAPAHPEANLPPGTHSLTSGTEVHGRDGKIGRLDEVVYDRDTGKATSMIIRKGFFFARELEAPIDCVEAINDAIRLSVKGSELPERRPARRARRR